MTTITKTTWRTVRLDEEDGLSLIIDHRGITPKKLGGNWSSTGVPALSAKNIKNGQILSQADIRYVDQKLYEKWMPEKLEQGDILLTSEAPLGEVYFLNEKSDYCLSQRLFALRANPTVLNPSYLYYYLKSSKGQHQLMRRISGTAAQGIRQAELRRIEFLVPSDIQEQTRTAEILSAFDDKIENNNRIIKTLEEMAQAIFKEWFVKFHFPGYEKVEFVDSELGRIPKGWEVKRLGDLGKIVTGKTPSTKDKDNFGNIYPFVTIPDLQNGMFVMSTERFLSEQGGESMRVSKLPAGAICVSCIATVGLVGITTQNSFTNQQINSVLPSSQELQTFLFLLLRRMKTSMQSYASGGTAAPIISKGVFEKIPAIVPSEDLVENFHKIISPMFEKIKIALEENQKLAAMRDLLLPRLMSGEIRV